MERPFVTLNMASSLDGKTTTFEHQKVRFGSTEDRELMEDLRSKVDAILIGSGTLIADDPPLILRIPKYQEQRKQIKNNNQPINIVASHTLNFTPEESDFFNHPDTDKIVVTTTDADKAKIERIEKYADVVRIEKNEEGFLDVVKMLNYLYKRKIQHLLLEGGGCLNFSMLRESVIDEIYLTLCPFVIGGKTAPTTFDGKGFSKEEVQKLQLEGVRQGQFGELFLKYGVPKSKASLEKSTVFKKGFVIK